MFLLCSNMCCLITKKIFYIAHPNFPGALRLEAAAILQARATSSESCRCWRDHFYSFTPPATPGWRLAARARPGPGRRLRLPTGMLSGFPRDSKSTVPRLHLESWDCDVPYNKKIVININIVTFQKYLYYTSIALVLTLYKKILFDIWGSVIYKRIMI